MLENNEINDRISRLKDVLNDKKIDAVLIVQNVNLFYYTGTIQSGFLFIPLDGEPIFFVKRDFDRAVAESSIKNIFKIKSTKDMMQFLKREYKNIATELDILPYNQYLKFKDIFKNSNFYDLSLDLRRLRMVKSENELEKMITAGKLLEESIAELKGKIKEGITEWDIACELEYLFRKKGHMGPVRMRAFNQEMYFGHVLIGEDAFLTSYVDSPTAGKGQGGFFPQGASKRRFSKGDILSIDFVFVYQGYMVDQTRIFSLGEPEREVKRVHNVAIELKKMLEDTIMPGVSCDEIVQRTNEIVTKNGLEDFFMGIKGKQASYVGHGIGLELDELPVISKGVQDKIVENVTFAFEPKFFIEPYGLIGIENTYVMKSNGPLLLTKYPEDIQIII